MEKKIDLQEILLNEIEGKGCLTFGLVLNAMKEAVRQSLELAAENATCKKGVLIDTLPIVNKQSILDTIKQVE